MTLPSTHAASPALDVVARLAAADHDQLRLDRLRELRAVIDTLRCEKESQDPLLAWVIEDNLSGRT
jgi:hypothetical protein